MKISLNFIMPAVVLGQLNFKAFSYMPAYIKSLGPVPMAAVLGTFGQLAYFIFMSGIILGITYVVTKFIAKKGAPGRSNKNLKLVETMALGVDKSVMLIKVGEQHLLIGSVPKNLVFLSVIDSDKLNLSEDLEGYGEYDESLEELLKQNGYQDDYQGDYASGDQDNHYISSVKQNLKKLKSIVRGSKSNE